MKKSIVFIASILCVGFLIIISIKYFRGENSFTSANNNEQNVQEVEKTYNHEALKDEEIKEFAKQLNADMEEFYRLEKDQDIRRKREENKVIIEAENVVKIGQDIESGILSYRVDGWEITKNNQGYALPEEKRESWENHYEIELDEDGAIVNDSSYVIVDVTVENLLENEITEYVWAHFNLEQLGHRGELYKGYVYLGEEPQRKYGKNYNLETIPARGEKSIAVIFIVKDEWIESGQFYIEINPTGTMPINSSYRWILLK